MTVEEMIEDNARQFHEKDKKSCISFSAFMIIMAILCFVITAYDGGNMFGCFVFFLPCVLIIVFNSTRMYKYRLRKRLAKFGPIEEILAELNKAEDHIVKDDTDKIYHIRFGPRCTLRYPCSKELDIAFPSEGRLDTGFRAGTFYVIAGDKAYIFAGAQALKLFAEHYTVPGGNADPDIFLPPVVPDRESVKRIWTKLLNDAHSCAVQALVHYKTEEHPEQDETAKYIETLANILGKLCADYGINSPNTCVECLGTLHRACTETPRLTDVDMLLRVLEEQDRKFRNEQKQIAAIPFHVKADLDLKIRENLMQSVVKAAADDAAEKTE